MAINHTELKKLLLESQDIIRNLISISSFVERMSSLNWSTTETIIDDVKRTRVYTKDERDKIHSKFNELRDNLIVKCKEINSLN